MSDPAIPVGKSRTENLLFHSRIEICRLLQLQALKSSPIAAELQDGHFFSSQILFVDVAKDHFFITFGAQPSANALLLDTPSVKFTIADNQGLLFTFIATTPKKMQIAGKPVIQFNLPTSLVLHNRRSQLRVQISPDISLRCVVDTAEGITFESQITDISHDGLGGMIYDPDITLEKGTILKGCRIIAPNGDTVVADLELRFTKPSSSDDGTPANHAGFHFVKKPERIDDLIAVFIKDLDKNQD